MSTTAVEDLAGIDISDMSLWDPEPPYELFARLRRDAPVHWSPLEPWPDDPGIWSITRHADVHAISRDWETFSSERGGILHINDIGVPLETQRQMMISMDPPRHDRLKALVQRAFTPKRVAEHADHIRAIVGGVLDRVAAQGECDLVTDIAMPIPARVIGSLLGTPPADDDKIVSWTNILAGFEDPNLRAQWSDGATALGEVWEYVMAAKAARTVQPQDDLLTALVHAQVDGDHLSDGELALFFTLLMAAGNDSTRATYSSGMYALMQHPDQLAAVRDGDQALRENAVEEIVRCFPAFGYMARVATRDVELRDVTIREGDKLALWYISANRDEDVFERADEFDVHRTDVREHQAFGAGGRHFCLGANLARLELSIWIEETLRRFPDIQVAGDPIRVSSMFLNQYRSLPVRFTPERG